MIPVKKNEVYTVSVEGMSSEGSGIAKIDGYTVFIEGALTGDRAEILIVKVKSHYGYGKLLKLLEKSPQRCEPKCEYFSRCGGCQLMCMDYAAQLEFKKDIVENNMRRIGGFEGLCAEDTIGADNPYRYRNKAVFPVGEADGEVVCGFYAQRSHRIVPMDDCLISSELSGDIMAAVTEYMNEVGVSAYNEETHKGVVRRIFIRSGRISGEVMVVISANANALPRPEVLIKKLNKVSENIVSIILNVNTKRTNLVLGDKNITLWGKPKITDTLLGVEYEISPHSFYQINHAQTEKLYSKAIELAQLTGEERVMDVYCGIGTISLCCAKKAKSVVGVEIVESAIEDAKVNARRNGIDNARFYCGSAEDIVPQLVEDGERPDVVMIDPPRKGSDERTLDAIVRSQPKRIVYVSCNSATLARDARYLAERGYAVERAVPVDMFPHTVHVECVVLLSKVQN